MLFMFNHEVYLQLFHVVKLEQLKEEWNESVKVQFSNSLLLINAMRYGVILKAWAILDYN